MDNYFKSLKPEQQKELMRLHSFIKSVVNNTEDAISYGIPTVKYKGKNLIHFAAFAKHYSVFPGAHAIEELKPKLKNYTVSKGTIQYTSENPIPDNLVREMIKIRLADIAKS